MVLKGKTALVTGGGTGIGAAITERFVAEGAKVCITGRRPKQLELESAACLPGSVLACPGDVSNEDDVRRMVSATVGFGGRIDVLVNNAAVDVHGSITELDPDDWRRIIEVNLTGPFLLMRESIPHMIRSGGGSIINIASIGALRCIPAIPAYGASKAGLIRLTRQGALEYGPQGVRCNAVCPGATRTDILEKALSVGAQTDLESIFAGIASLLPLRRVSRPSDMAGICAFLASDDSSFMTGAVVVVDGGGTIVDVQSQRPR